MCAPRCWSACFLEAQFVAPLSFVAARRVRCYRRVHRIIVCLSFNHEVRRSSAPLRDIVVTWLLVGGSIREGTRHRARSVSSCSDIDVHFLRQLVFRPRPGISSRKPYGELATVHGRMPSVRRPLSWRAPMRTVCYVRLSFVTAHRARRSAAHPPSMSVVALGMLACVDAGGCCCCFLCRALLHLLLPATFDDHAGCVARRGMVLHALVRTPHDRTASLRTFASLLLASTFGSVSCRCCDDDSKFSS